MPSNYNLYVESLPCGDLLVRLITEDLLNNIILYTFEIISYCLFLFAQIHVFVDRKRRDNKNVIMFYLHRTMCAHQTLSTFNPVFPNGAYWKSD